MTIECPCCRAANDTPTCRRCKADLGLLAHCELAREYQKHRAVQAALVGDFATAFAIYTAVNAK